MALIALLALAACGGDSNEGSEIERIVLPTLPPTPTTTTAVRVTIAEGQTERYIEILVARGMGRDEALATVDGARAICAAMAGNDESYDERLWNGIAQGALKAGAGEQRVRVAAVAGVQAFCPDFASRVPAGFDA